MTDRTSDAPLNLYANMALSAARQIVYQRWLGRYRRELAAWQALPRWRRWFTPKPIEPRREDF